MSEGVSACALICRERHTQAGQRVQQRQMAGLCVIGTCLWGGTASVIAAGAGAASVAAPVAAGALVGLEPTLPWSDS